MFMEVDDTPSLRETILSYLSGAVFAVAWWLWIDANVFSVNFENDVPVLFVHYLPGIFGLNVVSWSDLTGGASWGGEEGRQKMVRAWFFISLIISFGAIIAALWIAIEHWFNAVPQPAPIPGPTPAPGPSPTPEPVPGPMLPPSQSMLDEVVAHYNWPGVALILQNVLIFLSALLYRFARPVQGEEAQILL